jgi:hypothetical protein
LSGASEQSFSRRYSRHILAACSLSTLCLTTCWVVIGRHLLGDSVGTGPAMILMFPVTLGALLIGLVPVLIYGAITFALWLSFLTQSRQLTRHQLLAALALALAFLVITLAFLSQIDHLPKIIRAIITLFLVLQAYLALFCLLEGNRQKRPATPPQSS